MEIKRNGTPPSVKGMDEYFTSSVRKDPPPQRPCWPMEPVRSPKVAKDGRLT